MWIYFSGIEFPVDSERYRDQFHHKIQVFFWTARRVLWDTP
jgi:hypothetical protein